MFEVATLTPQFEPLRRRCLVKTDIRSAVFPLAEARKHAKTMAGKRFAALADRGSLRLLCSFPLRPNEQTPHEQDELYFVVQGHGVLFHDGRREAFTAGDAMLVAAGVEHHFEDFSDDLSVWVAFYGPNGGERGASSAAYPFARADPLRQATLGPHFILGQARTAARHRLTQTLGFEEAPRRKLLRFKEYVPMNYTIECEQEDDGRWLAEVLDLPGAMTYGATKDEAVGKAETLALRVIAERIEHGEARPTSINIALPSAA